MFKDILEYKLIELGKYELTVGMLLGVLLIFFGTRLLLYIISRLLLQNKRVLPAVDPGRKHSFYLILTYFLWTIAILLMMQAVGFEPTVLLASSAALLVGLGLGIQNIFRDIVSGIFLLFEGTIEIGDVLQVDDKVGRIEHIGLRTSRIYTREGVYMIVPNYKFITENVNNWSLHNDKPSRFSVIVGVSYGSDERKVRDVLIHCAGNHKDVLAKEPYDAFVRLIDFGNSSVDFELFFWTWNKFNVENVKSDLRFSIFEAFRENGITIPFPQRDLHIKSGLPGMGE